MAKSCLSLWLLSRYARYCRAACSRKLDLFELVRSIFSSRSSGSVTDVFNLTRLLNSRMEDTSEYAVLRENHHRFRTRQAEDHPAHWHQRQHSFRRKRK